MLMVGWGLTGVAGATFVIYERRCSRSPPVAFARPETPRRGALRPSPSDARERTTGERKHLLENETR